jgi:hypothetical protein
MTKAASLSFLTPHEAEEKELANQMQASGSDAKSDSYDGRS